MKKRRKRYGFSMVELMAVLIIIGLLASVVAVRVISQVEKARVATTKSNLKQLKNQVVQFRMDTGVYPSEEVGLLELIEEPMDVDGWQPGGYLDTTEVPRDGWKHEFIYELDPESGVDFVIISFGADNAEGGEGYDADLYSTDAF